MRYKKAALVSRRNKVLPVRFVKQDMTTHSDLVLPERFSRLCQDSLALFAVFEPPYIDYLFEVRFSEPLAQAPYKLWKEKALEMASKYPRVCVVGIAKEDSPLWLQISQWEELFQVYGNRIPGRYPRAYARGTLKLKSNWTCSLSSFS
jgi:hypothetical protein